MSAIPMTLSVSLDVPDIVEDIYTEPVIMKVLDVAPRITESIAAKPIRLCASLLDAVIEVEAASNPTKLALSALIDDTEAVPDASPSIVTVEDEDPMRLASITPVPLIPPLTVDIVTITPSIVATALNVLVTNEVEAVNDSATARADTLHV